MTSSTPRIEASVTFLAPSEGGRTRPANNSVRYRPHIVIGDPTQRIAKTAKDGRTLIEDYLGVCFTGNGDALEPGRSYNVELDLLYPDVDYRNVVSGASFTIREGACVVGFGEINRRARRKPPNNRLQRTVERHHGPTRVASFHCAFAARLRMQHVAAEPGR